MHYIINLLKLSQYNIMLELNLIIIKIKFKHFNPHSLLYKSAFKIFSINKYLTDKIIGFVLLANN